MSMSQKTSKAIERQQRNHGIIELYFSGVEVDSIATKYGLEAKQVQAIIRKDRENPDIVQPLADDYRHKISITTAMTTDAIQATIRKGNELLQNSTDIRMLDISNYLKALSHAAQVLNNSTQIINEHTGNKSNQYFHELASDISTIQNKEIIIKDN